MADQPTIPQLNDRWEPIEPIGTGAMGEVWRGRHRVLGHDVAIKLMKHSAARDENLVARFVREARIAAQLRHRHIARVEDFGTTDDGRPFLVMELLKGESLEDRLQAHGQVDPYLALTVARHVGAACDAAHAAGIVHRDLKPSNCFLVTEDNTPVVKVIDFGVARWADGMKLTQHDGDKGPMLLGTPSYMAPEQIGGDPDIDGRADLWSLAAMLYELLTGRLPFEATTLPALFFAVTMGTAPPPTRYAPALGAGVDAWAVRAFSRERAGRYPTGHALAEALAEALASMSLGRASMPATRETPAVVAPTELAFPAITAAGPAERSFVPRPSFPGGEARSTFEAVTRSGPSYGRESAVAAAPPQRRATLVMALTAGLVVGLGLTAWLSQREPDARAPHAAASTAAPPVVAPAPAAPVVVAAPAPVAPVAAPSAPAAPVVAAPAVAAPVVDRRPTVVRPPPVARPLAPSHDLSPAPMVLAPPAVAPPPRSPPRAYNPEEP
ncbi:MAG: serine/threonine-protein kinase [Myxococcales bacterium]|nr:serine/threonine-protein kinase [Myxococcales bacterium]